MSQSHAAQTRTATDNRPVFDVRVFGAAGDGSTDDTNAVQAAVNSATSSATGGVVYFPEGNYKVTSNIRVPANGFASPSSNISLLGVHGATITILPSSTQIYGLLFGTGISPARSIQGSIPAGATSFTVPSSTETSDLTPGTWVQIYTIDTGRNGDVATDFAQVSSVSDGVTVNLVHPVEIAFSPRGATQSLVFVNLNTFGALVENVEVAGLNIFMDASAQTANVSAVSPYQVRHFWFHDNVVTVIPPTGKNANFFSLNGAQDVEITHNQFVVKGRARSVALFECAFSKNVTIQRNVFEGKGRTNNLINIELDWGLRRFKFINNHLRNIGGFGVLAYSGISDGLITGNTVGLIRSCLAGIAVLGGTHIIVRDNILYGPTTPRGIGVVIEDDTIGFPNSPTISSSGNMINGNQIGTRIKFAWTVQPATLAKH